MNSEENTHFVSIIQQYIVYVLRDSYTRSARVLLSKFYFEINKLNLKE